MWGLEIATQRAVVVGTHSRPSPGTEMGLNWSCGLQLLLCLLGLREGVDVAGRQSGLWTSSLVDMLGDPDLGFEGFWTLVFM